MWMSKCQYFGHIIRGDGVQWLLMEGRINGRRGRGRPRTMWTDNIKEWTKISYNECIRVAQDRERWRSHDSRPVDYRWHIMNEMNCVNDRLINFDVNRFIYIYKHFLLGGLSRTLIEAKGKALIHLSLVTVSKIVFFVSTFLIHNTLF